MQKGLLVLVLALSFPLAAGAMNHGGMDHSKMDHGKMDHGGMGMAGEKIPLGDTSAEGISARGMLKDIREAMAKMGMDYTHHFMVFFTDATTGKALDSGMAALKVTDPSGKTGEPVKLMGMGDGFGADVSLKEKGKYTFEVGSKLADGQKRQFTFTHTVE